MAYTKPSTTPISRGPSEVGSGGRWNTGVRVRTVPNALIRDPSGQLPPDYTGRESGPQRTQVPIMGRDQVIPILYGGPERIAGLVYFVGYATSGAYSGYLIIIQILCEGTVEQITDIQVNDAAIDANRYVWSSQLGAQTTVDSVLAAAIPSWTETLEGYAFLVIACRPNASEGFPRATAKVKGRKVYDPRLDSTVSGGSGSHRLATPSTWGWTTNPALCLADFLYSYCGRSVNAVTLITAANRCDAVLSYGSPTITEVSSEMTLLLMDQRPIAEWVDVMRGYMPGWVQDHGDELHLIVDDSTGIALHAFVPVTIRQDPLPRLFIRGVREVPDVVEVGYTDTTVEPWATRYVSVGSGTTKARIELPGIRSHSRATRFATTRYNHYHLEPIEGELALFDYGVRILPGDLAEVTESAWGWTARLVRVLEVIDEGNGRWRVRFRIYDPNAYSLVLQSNPTYTWTSLPNPSNVPVITGLSLTSEYKSNASGTRWVGTILASWIAPTLWPYILHYLVTVYDELGSPSTIFCVGTTVDTRWRAPLECAAGSTYRVHVQVVSTFGVVGTSVWADIAVPVAEASFGGTTQGGPWVGDTPPSVPANGSEWWDSSTGRKFIYYIETGSPLNGQWVEE